MSSSLALPWKWRERPEGDKVLVFASRFDGRGLRAGRTLTFGAMQVRKQVLASPGAIGVSLQAHPIRGQYYTLSAWQDEASLREFAQAGVHRDVIRELHRHGPINGVLISWWADAAGWQPSWDEAVRRADAATPGPYAGPATHTSQPAA